MLRQQLIALLKAADDRPLRIMFPMIGRVEEWRAAKTILDEVKAVHPCTNLQVGIMIEVLLLLYLHLFERSGLFQYRNK